ncbi:hypothetical protein OIE66_38100 [Nonomuraea sp. NBC_01738]|uniref:hypothetical protein n=1 Tax=Nonomuraea sp. NBC_01738 TaxID=2976003 RepID=UPI002E1591FA|nr:hypothetical protein OIE66_38100 [Nonomuraea sp. NBC_01738]
MTKPDEVPQTRNAQLENLRNMGTAAIAIGLLLSVAVPFTFGLAMPLWLISAIALLVLVGVGFRIEAAIRDRPQR